MKIIINKCYGGFNLSWFAYKELLRRKGKECYFYDWNFNHGYYRIDKTPDKYLLSTIVSTKDYGNFTDKIDNEHRVYYSGGEIRTDFDLIAMIEEFGSKKCSSCCSELKVVEIPDDVEWEIEDYDGMEWVSEVHRTWE